MVIGLKRFEPPFNGDYNLNATILAFLARIE
jgi:hypothetical protein